MSHLAAAIHDAAVNPDHRGLMPVEQAHALLAAHDVFEPGEPVEIGGTRVLLSDRLWAALLSLEDREAFVAAATRLSWRHQPRGRDNLAPLERYGHEGFLAWARAMTVDGVLTNLPWCFGPCLLAIEDGSAIGFIYDLRGLNDTASMHAWQLVPPQPLDDDALAAAARDLLHQWIARHRPVALAWLAARAASGDRRAEGLLESLGTTDPSSVRAAARASLEPATAEELLARLALPAGLTADAILATLDAGVAAAWPEFNYGADGRVEYLAMRLIAARAREGDGWGIAIERLQGADPDSFRVARYVYGSALDPSDPFADPDWLDLEISDTPEEPFHGGTITGPAGTVTLEEAMFDRWELLPGRRCEVSYFAYRVLLVRAYVLAVGEAIWPDPAVSLTALGLFEPEVVVITRHWHHVTGPFERPSIPDRPWNVFPSEDPTWRSLAEAIVARDASRFVPGESNIDFQHHGHVEQPCQMPWECWRLPPAELAAVGHLRAAMIEAAVTPDARGLMPIQEARALVAARTRFDKGRGRTIDDRWVQDADLHFAALLSLEDAAAFAEAMKATTFAAEPRGAGENLAPLERYGPGLVAWFRAIARDGVLRSSPSCLRANLLGCTNPEVLELLLALEGFVEAGDVEPALAAIALRQLRDAWIAAHLRVAVAWLLENARADHRAWEALQREVWLHTGRTLEATVEVVGGRREAALARWQALGLPTVLTPEHILATLDDAANTPAGDMEAWPRFVHGLWPAKADYHALRLIGARSADGEGWGVLLERVSGYGHGTGRVAVFAFGTHAANALVPEATRKVLVLPGDGVALLDDASAPLLDDPAAARMSEPPDFWAEREGAAQVRAVRSALAAFPERFFPPPEAVIAPLGLGEDAVIVVVSTDFEHACGPQVPDGVEVASSWHTMPGASVAYRSLAEALVTGEVDRFMAGESNTGWALHAVHDGD